MTQINVKAVPCPFLSPHTIPYLRVSCKQATSTPLLADATQALNPPLPRARRPLRIASADPKHESLIPQLLQWYGKTWCLDELCHAGAALSSLAMAHHLLPSQVPLENGVALSSNCPPPPRRMRASKSTGVSPTFQPYSTHTFPDPQTQLNTACRM